MARVRLLVEATFAPGSARDGERATWCKDYTRGQAEKLTRLYMSKSVVTIRQDGHDLPALIDCLVEVDPKDLATSAWEPTPLSRLDWSHTDPEHLS